MLPLPATTPLPAHGRAAPTGWEPSLPPGPRQQRRGGTWPGSANGLGAVPATGTPATTPWRHMAGPRQRAGSRPCHRDPGNNAVAAHGRAAPTGWEPSLPPGPRQQRRGGTWPGSANGLGAVPATGTPATTPWRHMAGQRQRAGSRPCRRDPGNNAMAARGRAGRSAGRATHNRLRPPQAPRQGRPRPRRRRGPTPPPQPPRQVC
jgi:hypothetical protein